MTAPDDALRSPELSTRGQLLLDALAPVQTLHCIRASDDGTVLGCNKTVFAHLRVDAEQVIGRPVWDCLTEASAAILRARFSQPAAKDEPPFLLNFVPSNNEPFTLACRLDPEEGGFILLGETPPDESAMLQRQLMELNNQLAVLARENARKSVALAELNASLEKALQDLQESHWHLRKIAEVLPLCLRCGKVRAGEGQWQNVAEYLKRNALFLSHCYCPECERLVLTEMESEESPR